MENRDKIILVEQAKEKLEEAVELLYEADLDAHAHAYLIQHIQIKIDGSGNEYEFNCDALINQLNDEE